MNYLESDSLGAFAVSDSKGLGPRLMGADTLLGNKVVNRQEEDLGTILEIMLDIRAGNIRYAVLSYGGILGIGDKLFAVPWDALSLDTENECFVLDVAKERLEADPGFDKDNWPSMADQTWGKDVRDDDGTQPSSLPVS
jgi:sporulation protein YlmC with PRC-barrel domain